MSYTKGGSERRMCWALQAIDANRQGDVEKLKSSFTNRPGSNINTKTINGAYGGFKYPTWGKNYGGGMTSETLLHLAVREDNQCYPNRYMFVKTLVHVLKINTAVMNEHDDPARRYGETAQMLVDAVHPVKDWTPADCISWLKGLGEWATKNRQWVAHFEAKEVDGSVLVTWLEEEHTSTFTYWLEKTHHDLAHREVYLAERQYMKAGLKRLLEEFKKANAYRRIMEKPYIVEMRRVKRISSRKERKDLIIMQLEEGVQRECTEVSLRAEADAMAAAEFEALEADLLRTISKCEREISTAEQALEEARAESSDEEDAKGKKIKKVPKTEEEVKAQEEKEGELEDILSKESTSLAEAQLDLSHAAESKVERDNFQRWLELGAYCREQRFGKVHAEIEIEEVEEEISVMPAVCLIDEEREKKLELVKERNGLKATLEENYYSGELEEAEIELLTIEAALLSGYLPQLTDDMISVQKAMGELGDGEDAMERFKELDFKSTELNSRKYRISSFLFDDVTERKRKLEEAGEAKRKAENAAREKQEEEEKQEKARVEEKRRVQMSMQESKEEKKGDDEDDDDEGGGFRVRINSDADFESDEEGDEDNDEEDEEDNEEDEEDEEEEDED